MSYEWHTEYALQLRDWEALKNQARAELVRAGEHNPSPGKITKRAEKLAQQLLREALACCPDPYAELELLSQAIGATDSNWVVQAKVVYAERLPAYGAEMAARMQLWATNQSNNPVRRDGNAP